MDVEVYTAYGNTILQGIRNKNIELTFIIDNFKTTTGWTQNKSKSC